MTALMPGDVLREELQDRGWTQKDFAAIIGRPAQWVNEVVQGKKELTPRSALELAEALGTSAEYWLSLEMRYRLGTAKILANKSLNSIRRRAVKAGRRAKP